MFLQNVFKPILEDWNYGIAIGRLPKTAALEQIPVAEGDLGVMADVMIAQHYYTFDGNGKLVTNKVDRGEWSYAVAVSEDAPYRYMTHEWQNESTGQNFVTLEQHTVYYLGCKWGCLKDKTTEAPKWNSAAWQMLQGDPNYSIRFNIPSDYTVRIGNVDLDITARVWYGSIDITDDAMAVQGVEVELLRDTGDTASDNAWQPSYVDGKANSIHVDSSEAHGVGSGFGQEYLEMSFVCRMFIPVGGSTKKAVEGRFEIY